MTSPGFAARPRSGINHVLAYGQSLSSGWEGWPALSTQPSFGSLMLGQSVRPVSEHEPDWQAVGDTRLRPLVATVQDHATGRVLSTSEIAELRAGDASLGETVLEGAILQWRGMSERVADQYALAGSCGVGGRSLEQLSKGARPELFNRLRSCVRAARDVAAAWDMPYTILAVLFLQGENNSFGNGTNRCDEYKNLLIRLRNDIAADVALAAGGQATEPAMLLYQTGGDYASAGNAIAQAQLEFALTTPNCYLAAPSYPVCDKGGHLAPDGYRWLGLQFGKVMHRVFALEERWQPLHPLGATREGRVVRIHFSVPVPPLAWGRPFAGMSRIDVSDRGFAIEDEEGRIAIARVELDGADAVTLTAERDIGEGACVRYAAAATGGRGSLHDSDPELALRCFERVVDEAGQPYPLQNWCAAFTLAI